MLLAVPPDLPEFMTPTEVAALFRVHRVTVLRWVERGVLMAVVAPGPVRTTRRIAVTEVRRFINGEHGLADDLAAWMTRREIERAPDLCPRCGRRSIDPASAAAWCTVCTTEAQIADDQRHEREKARQRAWWTNHGQQWREQRRDAAKQEEASA
jgi:excisionase family DNA binding protein